VRALVREKYGAVAGGDPCGCGCCAGPAEAEAVLAKLGYTAEQAAAIPEGANLGLGCGNPIAHAGLKSGETVLDLGSGAGIDCFLAAREVGPSGQAIGVDMTHAMLERARATAKKIGATNVEFRLGEIEHLPVADASVDAIISNCVVNLSPDKLQVFREALRVLVPGGRLVVSDLVLTRELSPEMRSHAELYAGCVAGASLEADYLRLVREAGFADVTVLERTGYDVGATSYPEGSPERDAFSAVVSIKVRATRKP
jgi:SAM-dependent methyltransferase